MALAFSTSRLKVTELSENIKPSEIECLLAHVPKLLSSVVVEHLPPHFHGINSKADAQAWFERMTSGSQLLFVEENDSNTAIGFLFISVEGGSEVHIGYLLGENYWGQGFASELLQGFIKQAEQTESWAKLIGGVERANNASSKLLLKLGFVEQPKSDSEVVYYEYLLSQFNLQN
ncbi:MAG: GNAT family N-acetyltransferase [Kangiellaceae bacterium]|nr:GNAT family N-acetyltransferase [Kangiellaceae bacterium]MCW8998359.1 GNAT family N-acetyltransferase [Kangiellaceae bacterium]MCW9016724.1 GNAT family N-acetyltransferase [Kangiellaceae bacterium]